MIKSMGFVSGKPRFWGLLIMGMLLATAVFGAGGGGLGGVIEGNYTPQDLTLLIVYVLLALVFSFLCSVAEAVLLSITPSYIAGLAETHPTRAELIRKLKQENVDRSLAAILTLNTIAHTVGAIGSGAKATAVFGSAYFGLFSAVMTLLILFLSEIIPKTLGAVHWRKLAHITAHFVSFLIKALFPLIFVSELLTRLFAKGQAVHTFNRDEFAAMAAVGEEQGHINEDESRIIKNLFRMESLSARDIMTPRTVIASLSDDLSMEDAVTEIADCPFSRIPVYSNNNLDEVTGMVLKDELVLAQARDEDDKKLSEFIRPIDNVSDNMPLSQLLEFFLDNRSHIAMVLGDFGGTSGLVTLEDVVETLLGTEIVDEADETEDMQALARNQWKKRAESLGLEINEDAGEDSEQAESEAK